MTVQARSRSRAVSAFVVIVMCIGASFAACTDTKRSNGDDCIKSEDCSSGVCSALKCVAPPPLRDGSSSTPVDSGNPIPDGGSGEAGADSGSSDSGAGDADASDDGPAALDAANSMDAMFPDVGFDVNFGLDVDIPDIHIPDVRGG
jgi:hypothetical protein